MPLVYIGKRAAPMNRGAALFDFYYLSKFKHYAQTYRSFQRATVKFSVC